MLIQVGAVGRSLGLRNKTRSGRRMIVWQMDREAGGFLVRFGYEVVDCGKCMWQI